MSAQPIRVVFYCDAHEIGGAEVHLGRLLALLPDRFDVAVVATEAHVLAHLASHRPGVWSYELPRIRNRFDFRRIAAHVRMIARLRPDVLQISLNRPWGSQWAVLGGLVTPGVRVVIVEHAPRRPKQLRHRVYLRLISRLVQAHVTTGEVSAHMLARLVNVHRDRMTVIPPGVPDVVLRQLPRPTNGPVIGTLARLDPAKGLSVLLLALCQLPGVTAVLVGEGSDRHRLEQLAGALGITERVEFVGWSDRARDHLGRLDLFVLPSWEESVPLSIVEAMLAELPVVATDVGGISELVTADTGLLVAPGDPSALAKAIGELLADPGRMQRLGRAGRARALRSFSADAMGARFTALYERLTDGEHNTSSRRRTSDAARMRVVFCIDTHDVGGAEISLARLLGMLSPDIEATVMGTDQAIVNWIAAHRPATASVVLPDIRHRIDIAAIATHWTAIHECRPAILHVSLNYPWANQWDVLAALTIPGVQVVAVEKSPRPITARRHRIYKRLTSPWLAAHVTVGPTSAAAVAELAHVSLDSVRVIPSGVADTELEPLPRPVAGPIVGTLARLDALKGLDVLIRALPSLPGVTAVIVGEGRERGRLEQVASSLEVSERVILTGWSARARDHLSTFDLYVLPSRFEALGVSIIEAMLAELAVVATRVGGTSDAVLHGETGLLVAPDDPCALAEAIRELLGDPARAKAMGRAGRARAIELFSAERTARDFEALYAELAHGKR